MKIGSSWTPPTDYRSQWLWNFRKRQRRALGAVFGLSGIDGWILITLWSVYSSIVTGYKYVAGYEHNRSGGRAFGVADLVDGYYLKKKLTRGFAPNCWGIALLTLMEKVDWRIWKGSFDWLSEADSGCRAAAHIVLRGVLGVWSSSLYVFCSQLCHPCDFVQCLKPVNDICS